MIFVRVCKKLRRKNRKLDVISKVKICTHHAKNIQADSPAGQPTKIKKCFEFFCKNLKK